MQLAELNTDKVVPRFEANERLMGTMGRQPLLLQDKQFLRNSRKLNNFITAKNEEKKPKNKRKS